jgi:hypothetical protein
VSYINLTGAAAASGAAAVPVVDAVAPSDAGHQDIKDKSFTVFGPPRSKNMVIFRSWLLASVGLGAGAVMWVGVGQQPFRASGRSPSTTRRWPPRQ